MTLPQRIALSASTLAMFTIGLCYLLAVTAGHVPSCIPFIHGCTAITSTSVLYPEGYFFRAGLISAAVLICLWWYCMRSFLRGLFQEGAQGRWNIWLKTLFITSILASILLIISIAVMGPEMDDSKSHKLEWQIHAVCAVLFFLITTINQVLVTRALQLGMQGAGHRLPSLRIKQLINLLQVFFLVWLFSTLVAELSRESVNIIEWWLALLSSLYILSSYWDWQDYRLVNEDLDSHLQGVGSIAALQPQLSQNPEPSSSAKIAD